MLLYSRKVVKNMAYTALLNSIIENSGLTVKEIAERCKQYDVDITPAYISTLRNNKNNRAPSDKVSKALTKVCGYKNEEALIIEAYLDNAPAVINKFFCEFKKTIIPTTLGMIENKVTSQQMKEFETIVDNMPMADFITEIAKSSMKTIKGKGVSNIKTITEDTIKITQNINQAIGLPVCDDGMKPQIYKGNQVQFEFKEISEYKTGDIICYTKKGNSKNIYVRKLVLSGNKGNVTLLPINSEFTPETINFSDISVLGKVVRVISDIK